MLLDRHKVCACMVVAIIKVRLLSSTFNSDEGFQLSNASRINEQLAFMSGQGPAIGVFNGSIALQFKPSAPVVAYNCLWFTSLELAVATAVIAIIVLQWGSDIKQAANVPRPEQDEYSMRHYLYKGAMK